MDMQDTTRVNREHKDRLFRFIFRNKKDLLSLYNAVNDSDYTEPDALEIYTMEDYVYMGMKNDLSFLIDWKRLDIPIPRYYVFYNGTQKMEDEVKLYLTDSMCGEHAEEKSCVQFVAHMININAGHNPKIMKRCPKLYEYSLFVAEVRKYTKTGLPLKEAIERAVDECIRKGILADILRANRAEVTDMLLKEYDEALHISNEKEISYEAGFLQGQLAEKQKTEQALQDAEREKQNAEREKLRAEVFKYKMKNKENEEIAKLTQLSLDEVERILEESVE